MSHLIVIYLAQKNYEAPSTVWVAAELHPLVEEFISLHVAIPKRIAFIDGTKKKLGFGEREKPTALIVPAKVLHASTAGVLTKVS
ncbi:hypothetical protein DUI87_14042 [Hirundo rustica rustica]|uniref:Uncharacterized protein n=1 Tax=Hirundo rustica rustica TaxID=333673 RepID=A0A3M0K7A4_HIRRU|nr:hypothetical protein DUI87_14042 [Hirundo rustica rustica]